MQVRIGIATGLVVVGDLIGGGSAQEQAIVGETPNLAARLQALAEPDAILISEDTRRQIGALFELADLGPQPLKDFGQPQRAFRVLAERRALGRFEALRSGTTPLVGRDEEFQLLLRRWAQAKAGSGRAVLIAAEPGVGKSRLAEALAERIAAEPYIRLRYFCSPHHQDSALYPVIAQMERAAGFAREDAPATKLAKLQALLVPSLDRHCEDPGLDPGDEAIPSQVRRPDWIASPSARNDVETYHGPNPGPEDVALIAELHALPSGDIAPPLDVSPQRKKEKTFEALLRQVERLARQRPLLMLFEDIHWIDPSSRELLDRIMERIASWPVLLLATFRPEFQPPWTGQPHVTTLALTRLDRHDTAAMVANIAGNHALPSEIVQEIAERTDGVPLFVEELTKAVLESGAQGAAALSAAPRPMLSVPATLHASLMARLDRLGPAAKDMAQKGAVIGREFGYELLALIADLPEPQLQEVLDRLTNAGLLFARGMPPQSTYIFKHALVQDAAYGTLLRGRRQRLHARLAAALEAHFPDTVETQPEVVAHHFAEAGEALAASSYHERASERAASRFAYSEAVAHLRAALSAASRLPDGPDRCQRELALLLKLGPALGIMKGYQSAEMAEVYERARMLAAELSDGQGLFRSIWGLWMNANIGGKTMIASVHAEDLVAVGRRLEDEDLLLEAYHCRWGTAIFRGDAATALADSGQGTERYNAERHAHLGAMFGGHDAGVCAFGVHGLALWVSGFPDRALSASDRAVALAETLEHPLSLAHGLYAAAMNYQIAGRPEGCLRLAERILEISNRYDFPAYGLFGAFLAGWATASLSDVGAGLQQMEIAFANATGVRHHFLFDSVALAQVQAHAGRTGEAIELLDQALASVMEPGIGFLLPEVHRLRGELFVALDPDRRNEAIPSLRIALDTARRQGARMLELRAATCLARLWRDQGKRTEARDLLAPVYAWFTEGFDAPDLRDARALLAELA